MRTYISELMGTLILIYLGNGIVANLSLNKTKGQNSGFLAVTLGWACAVMVPSFIFNSISDAHFNPAFTLSLAIIGLFNWNLVPGYIICQFIGAMLGSCLVYLHYKNHFDATKDKDIIRGAFCTSPAIRNTFHNFISEFLTTFMLVFAVLGINNAKLGVADTFGVGSIIFILGIGLGGSTGYAINPARDLGPRIAHFLLPIKNKGGSDWAYSWIPVAAPFTGAVFAALFAKILFSL